MAMGFKNMKLDRTYEEAAAWVARQNDDAMDWDAFTTWLEADPKHRLAYDEMALMDARLEEDAGRVCQFLGSDEVSSSRGHWVKWAGIGGAAIAAGLGGLLWLQPASDERSVHDFRSPAGKMVRIALGDGGSIALAPLSQLRISGNRMDLKGNAFFDVPHRSGRLLTISAGDFQVEDTGTRFSIEDEPDALSVEVAEGSVKVSSNSLEHTIPLSAGHGVFADRSLGTVRLTLVQREQVGSWRMGKLQFDNAPLALVAEEISRYSDAKVTVDPTIAGKSFSGVIAINHGEGPVQSVAQILALDVKTVDGSQRLQPRIK